MFKKKEKIKKEKNVPVMKIGTHKKTVIALWLVLIGSVSFGVYKNFTAIDMHTIHEKEVIEQRVVDTNSIENFITNFAKSYYSWSNNKESIEQRTTAISGYLTQELQDLNIDTVRIDIPTSSTVKAVQVWSVEESKTDEYAVIYTVTQTITEGDKTTDVTSAYEVNVHMDDDGNLVIVKNPTITSAPTKSSYQPKVKEADGMVDAATVDEVNEFLETFFKLYPTASEKELAYYVQGDTLAPINADFIFSELLNPVYIQDGDSIKASVSVKFIENKTKAIQISQFDLTLQKDSNWKIIG